MSRTIFNKMIFCEEIFRFLNLEETLYFTRLDVDLNSFEGQEPISEETLLRINCANLSRGFTFNTMQTNDVRAMAGPSDAEVNQMVEDTLNGGSEVY